MRENRWTIRYADGTRWRSEDGPALEAPKERVLWVANNTGKPLHNYPFYAYDVEQNWWWRMDFTGMLMRLKTHPLQTIWFFGEQIPDDEWKLVREEMRISQ
jgi:hypothetical protein